MAPSTPRLSAALNTGIIININVLATNVHDPAIHAITSTVPAFVEWGGVECHISRALVYGRGGGICNVLVLRWSDIDTIPAMGIPTKSARKVIYGVPRTQVAVSSFSALGIRRLDDGPDDDALALSSVQFKALSVTSLP